MTDNRTTELLMREFVDVACECEVRDYLISEYAERIEQAIAATLGRPKAKSHPYGYERDTGAYDCTRCECGCINDISAMYCNDCGGEIEIDESAEKEYYDGYSKHTVFAKKHDDGSLEFCERRYVPEESAMHGALTAEQVEKALRDCSTYASYDGCTYYASGIRLQAIADELNAALGGGECVWTLKEEWLNRTGDDHVYGYETNCGARHTWWPDSLPNFCPTCGGRVEVER